MQVFHFLPELLPNLYAFKKTRMLNKDLRELQFIHKKFFVELGGNQRGRPGKVLATMMLASIFKH